jgi:hypothetical protein
MEVSVLDHRDSLADIPVWSADSISTSNAPGLARESLGLSSLRDWQNHSNRYSFRLQRVPISAAAARAGDPLHMPGKRRSLIGQGGANCGILDGFHAMLSRVSFQKSVPIVPCPTVAPPIRGTRLKLRSASGIVVASTDRKLTGTDRKLRGERHRARTAAI